jgi:hypothetical protein
MPRIGNNGMMEYWNVEDPVFSHAFGGTDFKIFIYGVRFQENSPKKSLQHYSRKHYSNIPVFHYYNCVAD